MDDDRQHGTFYILLASVRIVEKGGDAMRHRTARMLMAPGLAGFSLFYLLPLGMTCFYAFVRSPFDATFVALDNVHYDLSIWLRHSRYSDHHCGYDFRPLNTVADRMPNPQTTDPSR